jgi:ABC-type transport system substrate-binding protein
MKKLLLMMSVLLLLPAFAFAGAADEEIVDVEAFEGESTFEGVRDLDYSQGWSKGRYGGRMVFPELNSGPRTFNRIISTETSSTNILDQMYDSLMARNQFTLEPDLDLATSYRVSADQKTVTFTIPSGLKWSDGDDLTAKDFVFSYNQLVLREEVLGNLRSGNLMVPRAARLLSLLRSSTSIPPLSPLLSPM